MVSTERQFEAVIFRPAASTADFSCSEQIVLPGQHTEREAWAAVCAALQSGEGIGGEVRRTAA